MEIKDKELLEIILEFDKYLTRKIKIIAIGGTALTLLAKKDSTKDVDFCFVTQNNLNNFKILSKRLGYEIQSPNRLCKNEILIDLYSNGYIFAVQLESDYLERALFIKKFSNIEIFALSPIDLVITKTARLNQRDVGDIEVILKNYNINQSELFERYRKTMGNSLVRDAKYNLLILFSIIEKLKIKLDKDNYAKVEAWVNEKF